MSKIYFIRHAETVWNKENRVQGYGDSPITRAGYVWLARVSKLIATLGIDLIYTSELGRAYQSGSTIKSALELNGNWPRLKSVSLLNERNYGRLEGQRSSVMSPEQKLNIQWVPPGGESLTSVITRATTFLAHIEELPGVKLVVSHYGWMRLAMEVLSSTDDCKFAWPWDWKISRDYIYCWDPAANTVDRIKI
jgi:broad specificity phosphatase PhoE